ncbi:MAG: efflux RND transporter permease subunit [Pseudomonadota bacterium]|nr:efflux RND transporter permease subunit [Pseudomonadota bacterium]
MLKRLIRFFIDNSTLANLLTVAIIIVGSISIVNIRREVFPNISFDIISVTTPFPGASPAEVEKLVTNPMEQDLNEVDGIKRILSSSIENFSGITIYLDPDQTTADQGKDDVKNVVDKFNDLPSGAEEPLVIKIESKSQPIIEVAISADVPDLRLRDIAKIMEAELERTPGVAKVVTQGLREVEIRVEADKNALNRYHVSLEDLINALKRQNVSVPGGRIETPNDGLQKIVRTVGDFKTLDDVKNTIVRANDLGQSVRVSDVAKVDYALEEATVVTRVNGRPSLSLTILKKEKADAIDLVDNVKAKVKSLKKSIEPTLVVEYVNDFSVFIRNRLNIVTYNLLFGLGLVLLLLPFLLPFRFAFIVALGEPFAFLGAIILLHFTGNSINLISMIGLIIVSGILVDDSIVVSENAVRLLEKGHDPRTAALKGTMQIFGPLTGSALSIAIVFAAMAFVSGIFGKFIMQIPIAVIACLVVSLFECYFILPSHIAHWVKVKENKAAGLIENKNIFVRVSERSSNYWEKVIVPAYSKILSAFIRSRYVVALGALLFIVVTAFGAKYFLKFDLFPAEGVEIFIIRSEVPTGLPLEKHVEYLSKVEDEVKKLGKKELINFATKVGVQQQDANDPNTRRGSEFGQIMVFLTPENKRERIASEIIEDLRKKIGVPAEFKSLTFNRMQTGPPAGRPVDIGVRGKEYEHILPAVLYLKEKLSEVEGVSDILDTYLLGKSELQVIPEPVKAASAGLSAASIGYSVGAAFEGIIATKIRGLDEEQAVRVTLSEEQKNRMGSLGDLRIPNPSGFLVPLAQVARITEGQSLLSYDHEDHQRQVRVTAELDDKKVRSDEVNSRMKKFLPEMKKKFPQVTFAFGGLDKDTIESLVSLRNAFLLAIMGVFLILVTVFRNLSQPLVILMTVPMGIIAVIWAFIFHGLPLSFMGMLGIIALTGVIVNNAIVLIDFINQEVASGKSVKDSILEGSRVRARPIFLTTVTTVVGLLPTAYGLGGLDKFVVPIAMALGWGLSFGAILNAFFFPVILAILDDAQIFLARVFSRKRSA